jgi:hypothetical protein
MTNRISVSTMPFSSPIIVYSYITYDPKIPSNYNYTYDYLVRSRPVTGHVRDLTYALLTPRDLSRTHT